MRHEVDDDCHRLRARLQGAAEQYVGCGRAPVVDGQIDRPEAGPLLGGLSAAPRTRAGCPRTRGSRPPCSGRCRPSPLESPGFGLGCREPIEAEIDDVQDEDHGEHPEQSRGDSTSQRFSHCSANLSAAPLFCALVSSGNHRERSGSCRSRRLHDWLEGVRILGPNRATRLLDPGESGPGPATIDPPSAAAQSLERGSSTPERRGTHDSRVEDI